MKLLNLLFEIATTSYTLSNAKESIESKFDNYVDYNFKTDSGRDYYVRFEGKWVGRDKKDNQKYNWAVELTFFPVEARTSDVTEIGGENFGKIIATVIQALKKYVKDYKPEYVFWKGIVGKEENKPGVEDSSKRQRIYNAIMDRSLGSISGYVSQKGNKLSAIMFDGDIPVKGASDIFKYPEEPSFYDEKEANAKLSRFNLKRR
jgi:hypothetical protein